MDFAYLLYNYTDGDPGPFCLGRSGIYIREKNIWIIFLVFKGTDIHSGFAPKEDPEAHKHWVNTTLNDAWNLAGEQNRIGYVNYPSRLPCQRTGSLNISPPTLFGNFGSSQVHKQWQQNYAQHGLVAMGGQDTYANRHGREMIYNLWNSLQFCNLESSLDLTQILESLSYKNSETGELIPLKPLPFHPKNDSLLIHRMRSHYAWHAQESVLFCSIITRSQIKQHKEKNLPNKVNIQGQRQYVKAPIRLPQVPQVSSSNVHIVHNQSDTAVPVTSSTRQSRHQSEQIIPNKRQRDDFYSENENEYEIEDIIGHKLDEEVSKLKF